MKKTLTLILLTLFGCSKIDLNGIGEKYWNGLKKKSEPIEEVTISSEFKEKYNQGDYFNFKIALENSTNQNVSVNENMFKGNLYLNGDSLIDYSTRGRFDIVLSPEGKLELEVKGDTLFKRITGKADVDYSNTQTTIPSGMTITQKKMIENLKLGNGQYNLIGEITYSDSVKKYFGKEFKIGDEIDTGIH